MSTTVKLVNNDGDKESISPEFPEQTNEEASVASEQKQQTISKKQMKKLARQQRYLEARPAKRKLEKERKKARRRAEAQEREKSALEPKTWPKPIKLISESTNKFKVVIDMDFEDFMTDSEIGKATKQLGRIYSLNRHSENPCQLYFSSVRGKILDKLKLSHSGFQNWDVNLTDLNYKSLFNESQNTTTNLENFVYLSGDAEETLPQVDQLLTNESQIFVIGGLVDHNRHKNLCHERALKENIKTAKLPIKENVKLCQRHILSTVTVFEILLNVLSEGKQWDEALKLSIPKRKIADETQPVEPNLTKTATANFD